MTSAYAGAEVPRRAAGQQHTVDLRTQGSGRGRAVRRHMIERPARINVDSPAGILPTAIEIESQDGIRTLVRLYGAPALSS